MANPTGSSKWKSIPWNQWPGASPTTTPNSCCGTHPSATTPTSFPYSPGHYRASPLVIPARDRCVMRQNHNRAGTQQVKKCPLRYGWSRRTSAAPAAHTLMERYLRRAVRTRPLKPTQHHHSPTPQAPTALTANNSTHAPRTRHDLKHDPGINKAKRWSCRTVVRFSTQPHSLGFSNRFLPF